MNFGAIISELRKRKGISQGDLANKLSITQTYMSMIERDKRKPSNELLEQISSILNVPVFYILLKSINLEQDLNGENLDTFKDIIPKIDSLFENLIF